jgi:glycosyltransferase involved in cell wall biosynthesis
MPTVAVFRSSFLSTSETFIADHLGALRAYRPVVFCEAEVLSPNRPDVDVVLLGKAAWQRRLLRHLGIAPAFSRAARAERIALMHAHFLTDADHVVRFCMRQRLPLVVTAHGFDATLYKGDHGGRRRREVMSHASAIVCVSDFIRDCLLAEGYPADKLITLPLGVDLSQLSYRPFGPERAGILSIGRLVEKKGTAFLIRAYATLPAPLRERHPLSIVGDGPLLGELEALAGGLGVDVRFLGARKRSFGLELLERSRVFCLPSVRAADGDAEGMPIAIMEAMATGTPTVFFASQHMSERIAAAGAGIAAGYRDVEDLAGHLSALLGSDDLSRSVSEAGRRFCIDTFDLAANTARLEALYDGCLRR